MNILEKSSIDISRFSSIPVERVRASLIRGIHQGMNILVTEIITSLIYSENIGTLRDKLTSEDRLLDITGMNWIDFYHKYIISNPEGKYKLPIEIINGLLAEPAKYHDNSKTETGYAILKKAILLRKNNIATPSEYRIADDLINIIISNGYPYNFADLSKEIFERSDGRIVSWLSAVYNVFISEEEIYRTRHNKINEFAAEEEFYGKRYCKIKKSDRHRNNSKTNRNARKVVGLAGAILFFVFVVFLGQSQTLWD